MEDAALAASLSIGESSCGGEKARFSKSHTFEARLRNYKGDV